MASRGDAATCEKFNFQLFSKTFNCVLFSLKFEKNRKQTQQFQLLRFYECQV